MISIGIQSSVCRSLRGGAKGWPTVCTDASNMFYYGCWDGDNHSAQQLTQFQIDDNFTWVKGKHTLKFGFKGTARNITTSSSCSRPRVQIRFTEIGLRNTIRLESRRHRSPARAWRV